MPLLGGYLADAHWGRYKTIMIACVVALVGHALLVVSSLPVVIVKTKAALGVLLVGMIVMVSCE
jgi:POT family proton-dependent oligopeptide transporter